MGKKKDKIEDGAEEISAPDELENEVVEEAEETSSESNDEPEAKPTHPPTKHSMTIAIMMSKFVQTKKFGAQSHYVSMKTWNAGQVVYKESDILELISLNAPLRIFHEDVN